METPHVAADPGNSHQARSMINQVLQHGCVELLLAHQIDKNTGIEIATSGTHDHPATWGQSHAGVYRFAVLDGGDAGTIAEMSDDETLRYRGLKLMHDRFAGKAMKSVALDTER